MEASANKDQFIRQATEAFSPDTYDIPPVLTASAKKAEDVCLRARCTQLELVLCRHLAKEPAKISSSKLLEYLGEFEQDTDKLAGDCLPPPLTELLRGQGVKVNKTGAPALPAIA